MISPYSIAGTEGVEDLQGLIHGERARARGAYKPLDLQWLMTLQRSAGPGALTAAPSSESAPLGRGGLAGAHDLQGPLDLQGLTVSARRDDSVCVPRDDRVRALTASARALLPPVSGGGLRSGRGPPAPIFPCDAGVVFHKYLYLEYFW